MTTRIELYGLAACDTCRKARKALEAAQMAVVFTDIRAEPLDRAQIAQFLEEFGDALVNKRSTTWRALSDAERQAPAAELLAAHPTLMKRPVIRADATLHLGWDAGVQAALL